MGGNRNRIHIISAPSVDKDPVESWPEMSKTEVGARLAARIAQTLGRAA
jgi:hypothetical protein